MLNLGLLTPTLEFLRRHNFIDVEKRAKEAAERAVEQARLALLEAAAHRNQLLSVFWPNSSNHEFFGDLALSAANNFPHHLNAMADRFGLLPAAPTVAMQAFAGNATGEALGALFAQYRTDKADAGFAPFYARIFEDLPPEASVLEIGLGTNNPLLISTMWEQYTPGGSLRAMRDYAPQATIYGADIDREILFSEDRIVTGYVDQTRPHTYAELAAAIGCADFDLIIDDGLHSTEANFNTLNFALDHLRPGGWLVIEDIPERTLPAWIAVGRILHAGGVDCSIVVDEAHPTKNFFVARADQAPSARRNEAPGAAPT